MNKKWYVVDTNILLEDPNVLKTLKGSIIIPSLVIQELDNFKTKMNAIGYNARQNIKFIKELALKGNLSTGVPYEESEIFTQSPAKELFEGLEYNADNEVIVIAKDINTIKDKLGSKEEVVVLTNDLVVQIKANCKSLKFEEYRLLDRKVSKESFQGFSEVEYYIEDKEFNSLFDYHYKEPIFLSIEPNNLSVNEFVIVKSEGFLNKQCLLRYRGNNTFLRVRDYKQEPVWKEKPRNLEQCCALDLLMDEDIKLVTMTGKAGCGKTFLALASALEQTTIFKSSKTYDKIIVTRPPVPAGEDIGFLPGDKFEKMREWMSPIYDNIDVLMSGEASKLDFMLDNGSFEIEAPTYIRGRSLKNAFIIVDEAQNLNLHMVKTILTRAGEGSKIVLTGDVEQIDNRSISEHTNGLAIAVNAFQGQDIFGHITLQKGERSELATLASELL